MSTYFAILTQVGEAKLANAIALGHTLKLKKMGVGDGNGALPIPDRLQKALVREVRRADLNQLAIDPANASQIIVEQVLPEDVGGWWLREIGIYDEAGDLCAVANCPPSYKPLMVEGSGRTQVVRVVLIVASTAAIELKIDPSVILATRQYVDDQIITVRAYADTLLAQHLATLDPHPQYSMKEVATLPKFDASKKLANAEFINASGVKHAATFGFSAAATLTADHVGGFIYTFGAGGFTLKLPPVAALPVGATITYSNQGGTSSTPVTIATQSANSIQLNGGAVAAVAVAAGDSLVFVVVGANEWMAFGTGALATSASFAESVGPSGCKSIPGGFLWQWGTVTATPAGARATFRVAFPSQCLGVFPTVSNGNFPGNVSSDTPSITGFTAYAAAPISANFLAIGK
jgi:phage-related tail fiber protein